MIITRSLEFHIGSKEEKLPYAAPGFPYIASRAELDHYRDPFVPWHWHKAIELFYMESGELKYETPNGTLVFSAGSGGMVNSNILHMTRIQTHTEKNVQLLHIFDPELIAGNYGSLIGQKYIRPIITSPRIELIALHPDLPEQAAVIRLIRHAFRLRENDPGYEIRVREALSQIWLRLWESIFPDLLEKADQTNKMSDKIKSMMIYIHEHYTEKISVSQLAEAAFLSERECYRVFQNCLRTTPAEYLKNYRLQTACHMLSDSQKPVTEIGYACGLGSASYFGKLFRESTGYTPLEYRRKWQDQKKGTE